MQEALLELWNASFPEEELFGVISEQWKEMGWQGKDPSTDFRCNIVWLFFYIFESFFILCSSLKLMRADCFDRGGGFISLENLLFFAKNFPVLCQIFTKPLYFCFCCLCMKNLC